jgi:outer membrane protein assembly factor BamD (BamD/ComL family)
MSVSGISSSGLSSYGAQGQQTNFQKIQQEFQQLGQDLQSGNLSAAQSDFSALVTLLPQSSTTSSGQNSNKLLQAFNQLGQDLQAGNLADAQSDYANIQQAFQSQGARRASPPGPGSQPGQHSQWKQRQ